MSPPRGEGALTRLEARALGRWREDALVRFLGVEGEGVGNCDFDRTLTERVSSFRRLASDLGRGSPTVGEESLPEPVDEDAVSSSMD